MSEARRVALVTGASGFAGRHLVAELERETDWQIVGFARRSATLGERTRALACDLRDADLVRRVVERHPPDIVFHLAAQSYVPKALAAPAETIVNNVLAELHLLEAIRAAGADPLVVVVGSSEVYGAVSAGELPVNEDAPFRPGNPYAVSKVTQDMLAYQYWYAWRMRIVRLRPFNHFGPGQSDRFVVASFARQVAEAEAGRIEPVVLTGNLDAERDFLDVRDVVRAYRLTAELAEPGAVYNLASGVARPVRAILDALVAQASVPISVRQDPTRLRASDTPVLVGDASRFSARTGWQPRVPFEQSLRDTLDDWRRRVASGGLDTTIE